MRTKSFFKVISVLLAISLMVSALPINVFHFFNSGETQALEDKEYIGIKTDAEGNITNLDDATFVVSDDEENKAFAWLSTYETTEFGRTYALDVYCDSTKQLSIFTKDIVSIAFVEDGDKNCSNVTETEFAIDDTVFGTEGKMFKVTFNVNGNEQKDSIAKLLITVKDDELVIADNEFLAFQYGEGDVAKVKFPATGLNCAPISDIVFTDADNTNTIKYSRPENLKIKIDVSKMDGPFDVYLFDGDVSVVDTKNKTFDDVLSDVRSYISTNGIRELTHNNFSSNDFTIEGGFLRTDASNTYSVLLKDKYNHSVISVVKTERETVKVTLRLMTEDKDGNPILITSDANGNTVGSVEYIFLEKNGESAELVKEIPKIYGYIYDKVSTGTVTNKTLSKNVYGDISINIFYSALEPNAGIDIKNDFVIVSPTNDLSKEVNSNELSFTFDSIANLGNTDFINASILINIPTTDGKGTSLSLSDIKFTTGTFTGVNNDATLNVYQIIGGTKVLVKDNISLLSSETLAIDEDASALEISFSENALLSGANVSTKPSLTAKLNYAGKETDFDITVSGKITATYLDSEDAIKSIEATSSATTKVDNPTYNLVIKYVDLSTGEVIKTETKATYQVYDKIQTSVSAPKILKYLHNKSDNLNLLEDYDADNGTAYMPNKDVEIIHGYYAKKPYIVETKPSAQYNSVYKNDKETFYFNGLGACLDAETQEGNVPMYGYNMIFSIPSNYTVRQLTLPAFAGSKVETAIYYRYAGSNAWIEYTKDDNGETVNFSSQETTTIPINSMYIDGIGDLEIKVVYGNQSIKLPSDFRAQQHASILGYVNSDSSNEIKIILKTSTTYMADNDDGTTKETVYEKSCDFAVRVYQPSITDVDKSANLSTIKGDIYTYNFGNIANDGSANLKDFTFKYVLPDNTFVQKLEMPVFEGATGEYPIVFKDAKGDTITTIYGNFENGYTFENDNQFLNIKTIEIKFGDVDTSFKNTSGVKFTLFSTWDDNDNTKTLEGKGTLSATWTSENDFNNSNQILKTFTTTTKVSVFNELKSNIEISHKVALKGQKVNTSINSIKNINDIDVFNFTSTITAEDNSYITNASTGSFEFSTKYNIAKLTVYAYDENGTIHEVYNNAIPTENQTIAVPEKTVKLVYKLPVLPANTTVKTAPIVAFTMNGVVDTKVKETISYNAGTVELNKFDISEDILDTIGNEHSDTSEKTVAVGIYKVVTPEINVDATGYFTDNVKYTINSFKNDGNINLYNTSFAFSSPYVNDLDTADDEDTTAEVYGKFNSINIGKWSDKVSGKVVYVTLNGALGSLEGANPVTVLKEFTDVTELETLTLPTLEDDIIIIVAVIIDKITPNAELSSPIVCDTSMNPNTVKPRDILKTDVAVVSHYGIVNDENNLTNDEIANMTEVNVENATPELTVIKPAVSFPISIVSSETVDYRGQFSYTISNIKNTGNTKLESFEIVNAFSPSVRFISMNTPEFNEIATYSIYYRVNTKNDWILLQKEMNSREKVEVFAPELNAGEYITDIKFVFDGEVSEGFASTSDLVLNCINWSDAYSIDDVINNIEVNGKNRDNVVNGRYMVTYTPVIPSILQSGFEVEYSEKIYPTQKLELKYKNIKNVTEATIGQFALTQFIDDNFTVVGLHTGSYEKGFSADKIKVLYKTNLSKDGEWFMLTDSVDIETNTYLEFPELVEGEFITHISLRYGDTTEGFAEIESPVIILSPTEKLNNSSEYSLEATLLGTLDGKSFGETATLNFKTDFGFVNVTAKDNNGNVIGTYKVYGNVGEAFTISEVALKGYKTISSEGNTSGTYVLGESGNVTFVCKEVPKTGVDILTSWNFIAGATILLIVGIISIIPDKKKKATN